MVAREGGGGVDAMIISSLYFLFPLTCANKATIMTMINISMITASRTLNSMI